MKIVSCKYVYLVAIFLLYHALCLTSSVIDNEMYCKIVCATASCHLPVTLLSRERCHLKLF